MDNKILNKYARSQQQKNAELKHHNNSYKICDNKLNCFRIYTSPHLAFQLCMPLPFRRKHYVFHLSVCVCMSKCVARRVLPSSNPTWIARFTVKNEAD